MRVLCPNCDTKLRISNADEDVTINCPKCDEPFRVPAGSGEDDEDDAPPSKYRSHRSKAAQKKFPVVPVVAGGVALVIVLALVIGIATLDKGGKGGDKKAPAAGGDPATPANPTVTRPQPEPVRPVVPPNPNPGPVRPSGVNQPPPEITEL